MRIYYTTLFPAVVALCKAYSREDACLLSTMRAPPKSEQKTAGAALLQRITMTLPLPYTMQAPPKSARMKYDDATLLYPM